MRNVAKKNSFLGGKKPTITSKRIFRAILTVLLLLYFVFALSGLFTTQPNEIPLSEAIEKIKSGEVQQITVLGDRIEIKTNENQAIYAQREPNTSFVKLLKDNGIDPTSIDLRVDNQNWMKMGAQILGALLPLGLTALLFWYIFKQAGRAQNSIFSFGKSRAKLFVKGKQKVSFNDVAGLKEVKEELVEVVDFLKNPEKYRKMGARIPKGVLLIGPSGVGKTLLARAVAGEAGVPFFSMAGSEFVEMLVGVGASRVRDLFSTAKKAAPSIIFIDEVESIGRHRGLGGLTGGHGEQEQTLNQILVEMDGFEPNVNVIVLAATNRPDLLDPALLRPGRFDRRITLTLPDVQERIEILKLHARGKPFTKISWRRIARQTAGFSGADLENMLNEAAILAARKGKKTIGEKEIWESALKVKLGPEKKRLSSEKDKKLTAYHEAGHAIVSLSLPDMDPVERISIVSRGLALGYTLNTPKTERLHETKSHLLSQITTLMGGRAAEELKFDQMTTGAASDIQRATYIARKMVIEFGMSDLGPLNLGPQIDTASWGSPYITPQDISPQMRAEVDNQIRKIINKAYQKARRIISEKEKILDDIAQKLVEKETIDSSDIQKILKKHQPDLDSNNIK
jgi:cell division protease FtsH